MCFCLSSSAILLSAIVFLANETDMLGFLPRVAIIDVRDRACPTGEAFEDAKPSALELQAVYKNPFASSPRYTDSTSPDVPPGVRKLQSKWKFNNFRTKIYLRRL